jgi:MFS transporter, FSR family, fosmidomycin resistance protein
LAANSSAHLTEHLFNGIIAVILPLITSSLGLSLAQAGMLASARTLMAGAASFPSGFFADLARRRNLLLGLCIGMIGLASLGLSTVSSFPLLLIFMGLSGLGGGGFHPQSLGSYRPVIPIGEPLRSVCTTAAPTWARFLAR